MKTSRGMFVLGFVLGLLSWGSYVSLRADVGAWCYLPTVLFGALAAYFLAGAAVIAATVGTARLTPQNTPRPVRLAAPYAYPGLAVAGLVNLPVEAADFLHREHGLKLTIDLAEVVFAFVVLCGTLPSLRRRGRRVHLPPALAEVAATEAEEPECE